MNPSPHANLLEVDHYEPSKYATSTAFGKSGVGSGSGKASLRGRKNHVKPEDADKNVAEEVVETQSNQYQLEWHNLESILLEGFPQRKMKI